MDRQLVEKYLDKYPKFEHFIGAGTISLRMSREILDIDRYLMYDIFKELVVAGAVTAVGGSAWRATKELKLLLTDRRNKTRGFRSDASGHKSADSAKSSPSSTVQKQ